MLCSGFEPGAAEWWAETEPSELWRPPFYYWDLFLGNKFKYINETSSVYKLRKLIKLSLIRALIQTLIP